MIGAVRSPENAERVRALGAKPVLLDLLDAGAVRKSVLASEPEAIVHQATALADARFTRSLDRSFEQTNRPRTEGTDNLLAGAREAGVRRFVAQSVATYGRYAREGGPVKSEDDPLDTTPVAGMRETAAALQHLDQAYPSWRQGFVAAYAATAPAGRGPTASRGQSKALTDLGDELGPHAGPSRLLLYSSYRVNIPKGARKSHGTNADRQRAGVAEGA